MFESKSAALLVMTLLSMGVRASVVVGYDDASDSAYNSGWATGSNGGFGFGQWFLSSVGTNGIGDSNTNGSLGGPGINIGGKSWQSQQGVNWNGAIVSRTIGNFALGNVFEVDIDFGNLSVGNQTFSLFDSGFNDFIQIGSTGGSGLITIETMAGISTTSVAYSDGGYRLGFTHTSSSIVDVSITTLATSATTTYSVGYGGNAGGHLFTIGGNNPVTGQEIYSNRLKMTAAVPEPASIAALSLGLALLRRRR
jgi:hypothetical protein